MDIYYDLCQANGIAQTVIHGLHIQLSVFTVRIIPLKIPSVPVSIFLMSEYYYKIRNPSPGGTTTINPLDLLQVRALYPFFRLSWLIRPGSSLRRTFRAIGIASRGRSHPRHSIISQAEATLVRNLGTMSGIQQSHDSYSCQSHHSQLKLFALVAQHQDGTGGFESCAERTSLRGMEQMQVESRTPAPFDMQGLHWLTQLRSPYMVQGFSIVAIEIQPYLVRVSQNDDSRHKASISLHPMLEKVPALS